MNTWTRNKIESGADDTLKYPWDYTPAGVQYNHIVPLTPVENWFGRYKQTRMIGWPELEPDTLRKWLTRSYLSTWETQAKTPEMTPREAYTNATRVPLVRANKGVEGTQFWVLDTMDAVAVAITEGGGSVKQGDAREAGQQWYPEGLL
jgi:hypothetical protein